MSVHLEMGEMVEKNERKAQEKSEVNDPVELDIDSEGEVT